MQVIESRLIIRDAMEKPDADRIEILERHINDLAHRHQLLATEWFKNASELGRLRFAQSIQSATFVAETKDLDQ